ncbi:hypothetical protein [Pseudoduganella namucuonensis]|uniref:Uncharacterized protein n=1 Tax=Pseudoduganella namucuonensis TaxID=1035707 RepID=A0A1I7M619_9BURK|nr:hypothetical protein [Pseudoduganella namucuonensis]SFV17388.1 hypothetical protein SAMN05216552_106317 [Pseudoduganella namucuonensis]
MIINKRVDHATADIVETGVSMRLTSEGEAALRFLRSLGVGEDVILRILDPAGARRQVCRLPRPAALVLLRPPGLRLVT